jgi:hypothetical protein
VDRRETDCGISMVLIRMQFFFAWKPQVRWEYLGLRETALLREFTLYHKIRTLLVLVPSVFLILLGAFNAPVPTTTC